MAKVLFVCLGNICRSPAGAAILRTILQENATVDSCAIGDWHIGQLPDPRMIKALKRKGIDVTTRAQKFQKNFFSDFDFILAADNAILTSLYELARNEEDKKKIFLMTHFSKHRRGEEVPDPYYLDDAAFDAVVEMLQDVCSDLAIFLQNKHS